MTCSCKSRWLAKPRTQGAAKDSRSPRALGRTGFSPNASAAVAQSVRPWSFAEVPVQSGEAGRGLRGPLPWLHDGSAAVDDAALARSFTLDPNMFLKATDAPAPKEPSHCEEFPGGETICEVDEKTGTPTGRVQHKVDETNPCSRPCVELHESVHAKQLKTFCPALRDCYRAADRGTRPAADCLKMAVFGSKARECEAYKQSVPCMERRAKTAKECGGANKDFAARKLKSEQCFRDKNCSD